MAVAVLLGGVLVALLFGIHPFLAISEPVGGRYMVVEGWLHDDAVPDVLGHLSNGDYRHIITTGGRLSRGSLLIRYGTFAELAAETLIRAGVAPERLQAVPAPPTLRDRSYSSAIAVRDWFRDGRIVVGKIDVVTKGPHARRTRLLFQMALGADVEVGIIALPPTGYDQNAWWKSSAGVRTVISESIAYMYAKMLFWPEDQSNVGSL
jgi:hypothetical protein